MKKATTVYAFAAAIALVAGYVGAQIAPPPPPPSIPFRLLEVMSTFNKTFLNSNVSAWPGPAETVDDNGVHYLNYFSNGYRVEAIISPLPPPPQGNKPPKDIEVMTTFFRVFFGSDITDGSERVDQDGNHFLEFVSNGWLVCLKLSPVVPTNPPQG